MYHTPIIRAIARMEKAIGNVKVEDIEDDVDGVDDDEEEEEEEDTLSAF